LNIQKPIKTKSSERIRSDWFFFKSSNCEC